MSTSQRDRGTMFVNKQTACTDKAQVILIGASGSGKSLSGNTLLGQPVFISKASGKSVTQECKIATHTVNGITVTVVDTPGWDCTELSQDDVKNEIKNYLQILQGPYSFLLVIRVGFMETKEERSNIEKLKSVLGPNFLEHTTILFTRRDDLQGEDFKEFIEKGSKEIRDLVAQCGYRCHCWNNRDIRSDEALKELLHDIKSTETRYQHTLVKTTTDVKNPSTAPSVQKDDEGSRKRPMQEIEPETHTSENPIRVLFLGRQRVGKTSSIKTIKEKCLQSDTSEGPVSTFSSSGQNLKLVESPGFDDNPDQIQTALSRSLCECAPGPHVIIIVLSIGRFSPAVRKAIQHVQECLGQNARKHTLFLFTGADNLERDTIRNFIQKDQFLSELVADKRFHAFNNRDAGNNIQVEELLKKINDMYKQNNKEFYTQKTQSSDSGHQRGKSSWMTKLNPMTYIPKNNQK